jgi:hypothetical protein
MITLRRFTPGPWRAGYWVTQCLDKTHRVGQHPGAPACVYTSVFMPMTNEWSHIGISTDDPEKSVVEAYDELRMSLADATLISAAPELLRAVEKAYIRLLTEPYGPERYSETHQRDLCETRDALAKALGETEEAVQTHYEAIIAEADKRIAARGVTK